MKRGLTGPGDSPADDFLHALVENSSDAIAVVSRDGTIRFATRSSERVTGYAMHERLGRSAFELLHPDDRERVTLRFAACLQHPGVSFAAQFRAQHKNGAWRSVEAIGVNRLDDPSVSGIVINYRDVTERVRAEEQLRASEERLRQFVETAQDLIYYADTEGRFTYVNPTGVRMMKYEEHELLGRHYLTLIHRDYQPLATELYQRQLAERTPNTYFEFPSVTKDGREIWVGQHVQLVYVHGEFAGVQAIARDITRQKAAEDRLRESELRYRSLIQGAAYGIYRSTMDGRILDANPALARMLGYESVNELMTHNMGDLYRDPRDRTDIIERHQRNEGDVQTADVEWKRKDGGLIIARIAARAVAFGDGLHCFEGIVEDITAKRELEEQLRQAQKMEAVGRLARGVAHDFNNVLAAIVGCSDLLVVRLEADSPLRQDAEEIRKAAERGAALTRQLLAFSRRQALDPKELDLQAAVAGSFDMLRRLAGSSALRFHCDGPAPRVRAEPGQIEQVLTNLVVNARDAMPGGGEIEIRVDTLTLDEHSVLRYSGIPPGLYARITVADTGVGMDADLQRHVFEPFYTTKDVSRGTGLGLSIVYGIAKETGGTVTLTSAPHQGTTFEVLLPVLPSYC